MKTDYEILGISKAESENATFMSSEFITGFQAIQAMHDYASSRSMESQWIDVKESKKAVFDERKIRMAFKDFIEDVPNGTAREFFRFLIELSYDEQPPTKQPTPQQCDKQ